MRRQEMLTKFRSQTSREGTTWGKDRRILLKHVSEDWAVKKRSGLHWFRIWSVQ